MLADENNKGYELKLKTHNGVLVDYCGKVFIGETLDQAIKRELFNYFSIDNIESKFIFKQESALNRYGENLPRIVLVTSVNKIQIKTKDNVEIIWSEIKTPEPVKNVTLPSRETLFINPKSEVVEKPKDKPKIYYWTEIENKPAEFEYAFRIHRISSVDKNDPIYEFDLKRNATYFDNLNLYGKTLIGETLVTALKKELKKSLGVEKINSYHVSIDQEFIDDKNGKKVPIVNTTVEIDQDQLKNKNYQNNELIWRRKIQNFVCLSEKDYQMPARFNYFIRFQIYFDKNRRQYLVGFIKPDEYSIWEDNPDNFSNLLDYCGEVLKGETLEKAIYRNIKDDLGIEKITNYRIGNQIEESPNQYGDAIPRVVVDIKVTKNQITKSNYRNWLKIGWKRITRKKQPYIWPECKYDLLAEKINLASMEALDYLNLGGILAGNRFSTQEKAIAFVKKLYRLGALKVKVIVTNIETWSDNKTIGSATLEVDLPKEFETRAKLIQIANRESYREGWISSKSEEEKDTGQTSTGFGWD